jgi:hypothetical protein
MSQLLAIVDPPNYRLITNSTQKYGLSYFSGHYLTLVDTMVLKGDCTPGITINSEPLQESIHVSHVLVALQQQMAAHDDSISVYPIHYDSPTDSFVRTFVTTHAQARAQSTDPTTLPPRRLLNNDLLSSARQLTRYQAILYGLGGGHAPTTITSLNLPIQIVAASDLDTSAQSFMHDSLNIPRIFSTARQLMSWITSRA